MGYFYYQGNGEVGAYVERCLEHAGWERTEIAGQADAAVTYFPVYGALEEAYFGEEGLIGKMHDGAVIIELSPSTPTYARELAALAAVNDLLCVEAPICLRDELDVDPFADPARIFCFVGGEDDAVDAAMPVLNAIAGQVERVGGSGFGQLRRAIHTASSASALIAHFEMAALEHVAGAELVTSPLAESASRRLAAQGMWPPEGSAEPGVFTVEMLIAEVAAALATAEDVGLVLPQLESAARLLDVLAIVGGIDMGTAAVALLYCDEEASTQAGLDWNRAQEVYGQASEDWSEYDSDDFEEDGYDDGLEGLFGGAYGRFSEN